METARWIAGVACLAVFAWLSILNWQVFWKRHIQHLHSPSWIPLAAGLLGALGLVLLPRHTARWWWLPLLVDWGSAPGLVFTIVYHATRRRSA